MPKLTWLQRTDKNKLPRIPFRDSKAFIVKEYPERARCRLSGSIQLNAAGAGARPGGSVSEKKREAELSVWQLRAVHVNTSREASTAPRWTPRLWWVSPPVHRARNPHLGICGVACSAVCAVFLYCLCERAGHLLHYGSFGGVKEEEEGGRGGGLGCRFFINVKQVVKFLSSLMWVCDPSWCVFVHAQAWSERSVFMQRQQQPSKSQFFRPRVYK